VTEQLTQEDQLEVWIDQSLCTGDGICIQYAPDVFEMDVDGLAYVKGGDGELVHAERVAVPIPLVARQDVIDSANECPGECIHVRDRVADVEVYGPEARTA
jgi:ferredoxin